METLTLRYRKLFQVEVLLHYLLDTGNTLFDNLSSEEKLRKLGRYQIGQWMDIKPTPATKEAMNGLGWVFKPTQTGFLAVANAATPTSNQPKTPPPAGLKLDFELVANNAEFGSFSAFLLPGKIAGKRAFYLFDNAITNGSNAGAFPNLALAPPNYQNTTTYPAGSMVSQGGQRFMAKKTTLGNAPVVGEHWALVAEPTQYANGAHLHDGDGLALSDRAFGLVRIHCGGGLGNFGLFNGQNFQSPTFKIRLRRKVE
jgi:hypothetical protein